MNKIFFQVILLLVSLFFISFAVAHPKNDAVLPTEPASYLHDWDYTDMYPWSVMLYVGRTGKEPIGRILKGNFTSVNETLYSGELAYTLEKANPIRQFFSLLVSEIQFAGNVTVRDGKYNQGTIYEFDPYVIFRWTHFPWNHYLETTFAAAEGVSYTTAVPWVEKRYNSDCTRFLNYLMFEITFALPSYPRTQLVVRMHHRSGGYGLYGAGNTGSNAIGLGMRYYF